MLDFETRSAKLKEMRAKGQIGVSYEICIDEPQRLALLTVIHEYQASIHPMPEALEYWIDMLNGLPADEDANPGITHGFCL